MCFRFTRASQKSLFVLFVWLWTYLFTFIEYFSMNFSVEFPEKKNVCNTLYGIIYMRRKYLWQNFVILFVVVVRCCCPFKLNEKLDVYSACDSDISFFSDNSFWHKHTYSHPTNYAMVRYDMMKKKKCHYILHMLFIKLNHRHYHM